MGRIPPKRHTPEEISQLKKPIKSQDLWKINSAISWEWGTTFVGQHMQHNYRLYYLIDDIMQNHPNISSIVEIGTADGALTTYLGLWGIEKDIQVMTVDKATVEQGRYRSERIFKALGIHEYIGDEYETQTANDILKFIGDKPTFLVCDGSQKHWEFKRFTPHLPKNSVIGVHDWSFCCTMDHIRAVVDKHCDLYKPERWEELNVQFGMFVKR
jgi:hypothetical protein